MGSRPILIILTGAPGTGKTAILDSTGLAYVHEPAREVLAEERAVGGRGVPETDPALFVALLLQRSIERYQEAQRAEAPVLFDRGVPDCVAYARLLGVDAGPSLEASRQYGYERAVLVARPWPEIYTTDDERKMTFEATLDFQRLIEEAYAQAGYELVEIPRAPILDRVAFVNRFIEESVRAAGPPGRR